MSYHKQYRQKVDSAKREILEQLDSAGKPLTPRVIIQGDNVRHYALLDLWGSEQIQRTSKSEFQMKQNEN